jgi:hypothetical protein
MWQLHLVCKTYPTRPSDLVGIEDEWAAYQFDLALALFGNNVEAELGRGKALEQALAHGLPMAATRSTRSGAGYRNPAQYVTRKLKIPDSGIW